MENERCLHQLPQPTAQPLPSTIAVLGAGLNLGWLAAPWLQERTVAYWGDLDTWGLHMLAIARGHVPHLHALLMNAATFSAHQHLAVAEPVHAPDTVAGTWTPKEEALALHLRAQDKGRLEQEFLPAEAVHSALRAWVDED